MLSQKELKDHLAYDESTGVFVRKIANTNRIRVGQVAGALDPKGYIKIRVAGNRPMFAHRLAWLYVHGCIPAEIDHINGNRADNRICNLREVTRKQNAENQKLRKNNNSGYRGVYWNKREGKFKAQVGHGRELFHLGTYETAEEAAQAVREFRDGHYTHDKTGYSA